MPVIGFIDPQTGEPFPTDDYLNMAKDGTLFQRGNPYHYAALKTMAAERDVQGVSVTELLGCSRRWFLTREYPYYIRPGNHWRLYRGTSIHAAIEGQVVDTCTACNGEGGAVNKSQRWVCCTECGGAGSFRDIAAVFEKRYYRTVEVDDVEISISGQVDMYWPALGVIADHKDKVYAAKKGDAQPQHVWQLSIYAWVIAGDSLNNYAVPTKGGIYYQDGKGPVLKTFDLYDLETVEAFVVERLREFQGHGSGTYPEVLRDPDDVKLMCGYCPVADTCADLANKGR